MVSLSPSISVMVFSNLLVAKGEIFWSLYTSFKSSNSFSSLGVNNLTLTLCPDFGNFKLNSHLESGFSSI